MKKIIFLIMSLIISFSTLSNEEHNKNSNIDNYYEAQIILNNIEQLNKDGFITDKNAQEAKDKYVFKNKELKNRMENYIQEEGKKNKDTEISWTEYISFLNIMKFIAVIILIFAFHNFIAIFASSLFYLIKSVPNFIYQSIFMTLGIVITFVPNLIWESQSFYLAFLGSFINIIILYWIGFSYNRFFNKFISLVSFGIRYDLVACIYGSLYFGLLTILYSSNAFGLLAVGFVVASTGFLVHHSYIGVALGVSKEDKLINVIFSNLIILLTYSIIKVSGFDLPYIDNFSIGIEFLCSLALGICLLIASSPMRYDKRFIKVSTVLMFLCSGLALMGSVFFGLTTIAAFLNTIFVLYVLEWIGYISKKTGWVVFLFAIGISLYGLAILLEEYPQYFVNSLI